MEINFSPSQRSKTAVDYDPAIGRSAVRPQVQLSGSGATVDVNTQLSQISMVRQDKVQSVQEQMLMQQYPPDIMVDRIASLLAVHLAG
jgi:hypothetical protein